MEKDSILVPVDFSDVSERVVKTASYYAKRNHLQINLLHIEHKDSADDNIKKLEHLVQTVNGEKSGLNFEFIIKKGNTLSEIVKESEKENYRMMVIGSHGYKGLREKLFGADILKLIKSVSIPCLSVQKNLMIAGNGAGKILFPVGSHNTFINQINATIDLVRLSNAVVYIYLVVKPGVSFSDEFMANLQLAEDEFMKNGISYKKVKEEQVNFSVGFARQILDFARRERMDMISIMANAAREHHYIADPDKLLLLTNESGIPVFSCNEKFRTNKHSSEPQSQTDVHKLSLGI